MKLLAVILKFNHELGIPTSSTHKNATFP